MAQEVKFTTDGRKVVVIGSLNSQEKIVQEIFIIDGSEIPSGEHFVVKSLHDAVAVSWKDKDIKDKEDYYERKKKEIADNLDKLEKNWRSKQTDLQNKIEYAGLVIKNISPDSFKIILDFLTHKIKWVVKTGYSPELIEWDKFEKTYEREFRLISLFGRDNGTLSYAMGKYSDYSGGHSNFVPFDNYEDALERLKKELVENGMNDSSIKTAARYDIQFPAEMVSEYKAKKIAEYEKNAENSRKSVQDYENRIAALQSL